MDQHQSLNTLKYDDFSRLIEMAWQDRTPFEAIQTQYALSENDVKRIMKSLLKNTSFRRWRKRVQGRKTKHHQKYLTGANRFQGPW